MYFSKSMEGASFWFLNFSDENTNENIFNENTPKIVFLKYRREGELIPHVFIIKKNTFPTEKSLRDGSETTLLFWLLRNGF